MYKPVLVEVVEGGEEVEEDRDRTGVPAVPSFAGPGRKRETGCTRRGTAHK